MPEIGEFTITGLDSFKKEIERLNFADRRSVLVKAVLRAAEPIKSDAESNAPVDTGRLSRSIVAQEDKKNSDLDSVTVDIGVTSKAFYGFFQEFGTAFMIAQPFLNPAVEENQSEVEASLAEKLDEEIAKALS